MVFLRVWAGGTSQSAAPSEHQGETTNRRVQVSSTHELRQARQRKSFSGSRAKKEKRDTRELFCLVPGVGEVENSGGIYGKLATKTGERRTCLPVVGRYLSIVSTTIISWVASGAVMCAEEGALCRSTE